MDMRIGAQFYTIRNFCQTLDDFDESCRKIKEIGYKIIQLSGIGNFSGSEIRSITDKYGLEVVCTHRAPLNYLENIDEEIKFHKEIGSDFCGIGCMPGGCQGEDDVKNFIENFTPVCNKLKEAGLEFAYHNHSYEFQKVDGKHIIDIISESMPSDSFKYILDVYWVAYAGIDPAKFIRKNSDKIGCIHLKDLKIVKGSTMHVPTYAEIGVGNLDWDEIIEACKGTNAKYALVEQDICDGDPFESLKISYDFLSGKGFY